MVAAFRSFLGHSCRVSRVVGIGLAFALGVACLSSPVHAVVYTWQVPSGAANWNVATNWLDDSVPTPLNVVPLSAATTELNFNGSGGTAYTATDDIAGAFQLNVLRLNSSATVAETIAAGTGNSLSFVTQRHHDAHHRAERHGRVHDRRPSRPRTC